MMVNDGGFPDGILYIEVVLGLFIGALTIGCVFNWFREWRHDPQGRIFFTSLTCVSVLITLGIIADYTRRILGH